MTMMERRWIDIGPLADIPLRGARVVHTAAVNIAVFHTAAGTAFAIEDRCPHKGGPLSEGIVHGSAVTCPLHNWVIDLASGEAQGADKGCVKTIPLLVEGGRVLLDVTGLGATPVA
jgi:nitrite reductase (NADH) small subunit